jgi:YVTN family beta-propeller protein
MPTCVISSIRFRFVLILISTFLVTALLAPAQVKRSRALDQREKESREKRQKEEKQDKEEKERRFDDPSEEEELNRDLWQFARGTPYDQILPYVTEEQRKSRANQNAEVELPTGWRITPAGRQVEVGKLPFEAIPFAGKLVVLDTGYYYKEPQEVSIVNTDSGQVEKTLKIQSLFPSAVVGPDGDLYISGGFDQKIVRVDKQFNIVREYPVAGFAAGIAQLDSQRLMVGYLAVKNKKGEYLNGRLAILNANSGKIEKQIDLGYFPYSVRSVNDKFYVTLLGENKLLAFNAQLKLLKTIAVGRTPQEMCSDGKLLYVVNTGSDSLSVIDTRTNALVSTISVAAKGSTFGTAPSSCQVNSNRLYVTLANTNSVAILDRARGRGLARLPTGWYPTKILIDKQQLIVLNAKGIQARRPNPEGPRAGETSRVAQYVLNLLKGTASIIPLSDVDREATGDANSGVPLFDPRMKLNVPIKHVFYIIKENRTYDQVLGDFGRGNGDPKLTMFGESVTPVHHQLAREFVTLDNFFVDGEISVLGHSFTTSGYASPFTEWLGNLSYSERWKGYPYGTVPATMSPVYLWDLLDDRRLDYRIYGETYFLFNRAYRIFVEKYGAESKIARRFYDKTIAAAAGDDRGTEFNELTKPHHGRATTREDAYRLLGEREFVKGLSRFLTGDDTFERAIARDVGLRRRFADYLYHYSFSFRSWDLKVSDLDRVREWKKDFETQLRLGKVAQLHYIWLPNDHTDGSRTRYLNAFQFMAQNDAALGRIMEIISHSPVWKDSLVLVVEDDAQNGPDHVDATRTIAFAAGPYVKRGTVVSDLYDQLSMLRTIELLLELRSSNLGSLKAAPMFGIFTDKPDFRPFLAAEPSRQLAPADMERYRALGQ